MCWVCSVYRLCICAQSMCYVVFLCDECVYGLCLWYALCVHICMWYKCTVCMWMFGVMNIWPVCVDYCVHQGTEREKT